MAKKSTGVSLSNNVLSTEVGTATALQESPFAGIATKTGVEITDTALKGCEVVGPEDLIDPHLIKDTKKILPDLLSHARAYEQQLKEKYIQTYQPAYEELQRKRAKKGKEIPSLETIIENFMCLSDTRRAQEATDLVLEKFSADQHIQAMYEHNLAEWKTCILDVHRITIENKLQPFELAQRQDLMRQGIQQMQECLQQHGVSASQTKQIYELLADHGYLGTIEEIEKVKKKIEKLADRLDIGWDKEDYSHIIGIGGGIMGGVIAICIAVIVGAVFYKEEWPSSWVITSIGLLSVLAGYLLAAYWSDEMVEAIALLAYPINKPRHLYLKRKLKALEQRHDKIKAIQHLIQDLDNFSQDYDDLDTMSNTQVEKLLQRLTNIGVLQTRLNQLGQHYTFEQLSDGLTDKELIAYVAQIRAFDEKRIYENLQEMIRSLSDDGFDEKTIAEMIKDIKKELAKKYIITLPSDIVSPLSNKSVFEVIEDVDKQVESMKLSKKQKVKYESAQAQALSKEISVAKLLRIVSAIVHTPLSGRQLTKEGYVSILGQMGITEADNSNLVFDFLDKYVEKKSEKNTPLSLGSDKETGGLDLDELNKRISARKLAEQQKLSTKIPLFVEK